MNFYCFFLFRSCNRNNHTATTKNKSTEYANKIFYLKKKLNSIEFEIK